MLLLLVKVLCTTYKRAQITWAFKPAVREMKGKLRKTEIFERGEC